MSIPVKFTDLSKRLGVSLPEYGESLSVKFGGLQVPETSCEVPNATREQAGVIRVGDNLEITPEGVLSVMTTDRAEAGDTRPITSAGVYTQLGNIEILLAAL